MYKNLKIGQKLFVGFATVTLLSIIMIAFALLSLNNVGGLTHQLFAGPYVSTTESLGIKHDLNVIGKDIRSAIIEENVNKYLDSIDSTEAQLEARIAKIKEVFTGDAALVTAVEQAEVELANERDAILSALKMRDYEKATQLLGQDYALIYTKTNEAADAL
ncbi:MAG: MCP four helix bundle domain-containing protein, partial [Oscillospiraceae bacterium]